MSTNQVGLILESEVTKVLGFSLWKVEAKSPELFWQDFIELVNRSLTVKAKLHKKRYWINMCRM